MGVMRMRRPLPTTLTVLILAATAGAVPAAPAAAAQSTRLDVAATLLTQPVGRPWAIDLDIASTVTTPDGGPPSPLRQVDLRFPRASIHDDAFPSCDATALIERGAPACPKGSKVGTGSAVADVRPLIETRIDASIDVYNGPRRNGGRVLIFDVRTKNIVNQQFVMQGLLKRTSGRYGYRLTLAIPQINTIPGSPPAAITSFRVKVGAHGNGRSYLEAPRSCPRGGLPFAGRYGYADGSRSSAQAAIACTLSASSQGAAAATPEPPGR
jgi:hypothetical protein